MAEFPSGQSKLGPAALKAAGCATAFFLGGPIAAGIAAWGSTALLDALQNTPLKDSAIGDISEAISGNLNSFIAGAFFDQVKYRQSRPLRSLYLQALSNTLRQIEADHLPELETQEDREYYRQWYARWQKLLKQDKLQEFDDPSILKQFVRKDAKTVEEAFGRIVVDILIRLDASGVLKLSGPPLDQELESLLLKKLPVLLPIHLDQELSKNQQEFNWVLRQSIYSVQTLLSDLSEVAEQTRTNTETILKGQADHSEKLQTIESRLDELRGLHRHSNSVTDPNVLRADSNALLPRHGVFVGGHDLVDEIANTLRNAGNQIVFVYGAPGIGKSELCRASIRSFLRQAPASAALQINLQSAHNLQSLLASLAEQLGDTKLGLPQELLSKVTGVARSFQKGLILYFDNFESVLADSGAIPFLRSLAGLDRVRTLVSCRQNLQSSVGTGFELRRLPVEAARELFLACWKKANPRLPLPQPRELEEFLDRQLACHPLSIVLTAGEGAVLRSFPLLLEHWQEKGITIAKSPEESLEASLDLSWNLLNNQQQQLLLLLAFFPEGMTAATWNDLKAFIPEAGDCRVRLCQLSLVDVSDDGQTLSMLAPIREYVFRKGTATGPAPDAQAPDSPWQFAIRTALRYYVQLAKNAIPISGAEADAAHLRLANEMLNLHEVLSKLEGKHLVEAGMDFRTLYSGLVNAYQFSPAAGALAARRVLALCQEIGDPLGEAISLQSLGYLAMRLSDLDQARQRLEAALALFQETGERLGEANTLRSLGDLAKRLGDLDQARQRLEDALALYQEIGARLGLAKTLRRLGLIA